MSDEDQEGRRGQCPELQAHQGHREERTQRHVRDQGHRRSSGTGQSIPRKRSTARGRRFVRRMPAKRQVTKRGSSMPSPLQELLDQQRPRSTAECRTSTAPKELVLADAPSGLLLAAAAPTSKRLPLLRLEPMAPDDSPRERTAEHARGHETQGREGGTDLGRRLDTETLRRSAAPRPRPSRVRRRVRYCRPAARRPDSRRRARRP